MSEAQNISTIKITLADSGRVLNHDINSPLLETLLVAGEDVPTECGGTGICGSCNVQIPNHPPEAQPSDFDFLETEKIKAGWRLSCQCHPLEDSMIELDREVANHGMIIQTAGHEIEQTNEENIPQAGIGLALDLGTTTIVGYITFPHDSEDDLIVAFPNPQRMAGGDVISRIAYAHQSQEALGRLTKLVTGQIERRVIEALSSNGYSADDITRITVAGNMTMAHLFVGADPWTLGVAPYQPSFIRKPVMKAGTLGFETFKKAEVKLIPGIAGHLGGDTVAGLYALNLTQSSETALFLDLGTNGEIILVHEGAAIGCSCAAGPAFEGVKISCGMPAVPGAINEVTFENGDLAFSTFGDHEPIGLCGSGLAELISLLLRTGIIDPSGRIRKPDEVPQTTSSALSQRIIIKGRKKEIFIATGTAGHAISLSQLDIREVQLAKAAFRTGIEALCTQAQISTTNVDKIYVAGGFGNALKSEALIALGILPADMIEKIKSVGNIAGVGARKALRHDLNGQACDAIGDWVRHFPLESAPDFTKNFTAELGFPAPDEVAT